MNTVASEFLLLVLQILDESISQGTEYSIKNAVLVFTR